MRAAVALVILGKFWSTWKGVWHTAVSTQKGVWHIGVSTQKVIWPIGVSTQKGVCHTVVNSQLFEGLEFTKMSCQQGLFSKLKKKKKASHMMLSQGCWVGGVWLLTFLLQDAELWPLLCRKQHCYGVIPLLWFHLWLMPLVRENNLGRMLTTSSPAWLKNVAKSCLLHWNPGLWMDNSLTSLSLASSIHTLFACYEGMP